MNDTSLLKSMVKSYYDCQKLRISIGNRIVQNVRVRLGQNPGRPTEEMDDEGVKLLNSLTTEYTRITDQLAANANIRSKIKAIEKQAGVITDIYEYELIGLYMDHLDSEATLERTIGSMLELFPIYTEFLLGVRGCGTKMSAIVISSLDPHRAHHVSGFWKYAGLDVVINEDGVGEGRCRKASHLREVEYIDSKGESKTRVGLTFNPELKTKLIGVLGPSFLKSRSPYADIYAGYKHRLITNPALADMPLIVKHNRAIRYMVKAFLRDLWVKWRELEGLPVTAPYAEEKFGLKHGADRVS